MFLFLYFKIISSILEISKHNMTSGDTQKNFLFYGSVKFDDFYTKLILRI